MAIYNDIAPPSPTPYTTITSLTTITIQPSAPVVTQVVLSPRSTVYEYVAYIPLPQDYRHRLSTAQIIGIVFGTFFGALLIGLLVGLIIWKLRKPEPDVISLDFELGGDGAGDSGDRDDSGGGGGGGDNDGGSCSSCTAVDVIHGPPTSGMWPPFGTIIPTGGGPFWPSHGGGNVDVQVNTSYGGYGRGGPWYDDDDNDDYSSSSDSESSLSELDDIPSPSVHHVIHHLAPAPMGVVFEEEAMIIRSLRSLGGSVGGIGGALPGAMISTSNARYSSQFSVSPSTSVETFGEVIGADFPIPPGRMRLEHLWPLGDFIQSAMEDKASSVITSVVAEIAKAMDPISRDSMTPISSVPHQSSPPAPSFGRELPSGFPEDWVYPATPTSSRRLFPPRGDHLTNQVYSPRPISPSIPRITAEEDYDTDSSGDEDDVSLPPFQVRPPTPMPGAFPGSAGAGLPGSRPSTPGLLQGDQLPRQIMDQLPSRSRSPAGAMLGHLPILPPAAPVANTSTRRKPRKPSGRDNRSGRQRQRQWPPVDWGDVNGLPEEPARALMDANRRSPIRSGQNNHDVDFSLASARSRAGRNNDMYFSFPPGPLPDSPPRVRFE